MNEIYTILPNKKGKVVVKDLNTGKEETIKNHLKRLRK